MEPTLAQLLASRAEFAPQKEAYVYQGERLSYAEANARAERMAAHLLVNGIAAGDRLLLLAKNSEFLATMLFAASRIGAITVVGNWRLPAAELEYIVRDSGAIGFFVDEEFAGLARELSQRIPELRLRIVSGDAEGPGEFGYQQLVETDNGAGFAPEIVGTGKDDAVIMYTSGTTGHPKGVVLTNANLFWAAQGKTSTIIWEADHRFLLVAPMFHIGGLAPLICNVLRGTTTIFMRDFDPVAVWEMIEQERITNMMAVPVMLNAMLKVARTKTVDTSSVVEIMCGGAMVPASLITAYSEIGVAVSVVFGITEFGGAVTFWTPAMGLDQLASEGRPVFASRLRVVDTQTGEPVAVNEPGELLCWGPQRFDRYWNNNEATAAAITPDGWYRSGDVGRIDEAGFVYVVDRLKDVIISGGENIYPAEVETAISSHPAVAEVAVVGREDHTWGEVPVAYVVLQPAAAVSEDALIEYTRERIASYKRPKQIEFIEQLPKNSLGKLLRRELRGVRVG